MTPELAGADRAAAVRAAARSWRRTGVIDDAALAAVESRFPDDRVRVGPVFRALLFLFTLIGAGAFLGFVALAMFSHQEGALALLALLAGAALWALTEVQVGHLRRRQGGVEAATSLLAIALLLGAAGWFLWSAAKLEPAGGLPALCLLAAALAGIASWRWGYPLYAAAAAAAVFVALARLPAGRVLWIALPLAAAPALLRLSASPRLAPAHRSAATAVLLVATAGLYLAVNAGTWEDQLVERLGGREPLPAPLPHAGPWWWSAAAATALVPVLVLVAGVRRRRLPLLLAGAAAAVASIVTLIRYLHLGPAWLVLTLGGALWVAVALGLWRYLESGTGQERHGFTAAPLLTDRGRQAALEAGLAVLTLHPAARPTADGHGFEGGGGRSGGGGASGEF
ncbi:MAG TPA: hypothetical protein VMW75_03320 [Thermoanaerobaculia bacterium]|nr:hypothetical protein [Thermoanaerobaculia bacterium]